MIRVRAGLARWVTLGVLIASGCSDRSSPDALPPPTPGLEVRDESYAAVRRGFTTKLDRLGPSTADPTWPATPPGASLVRYASGELNLGAFATPEPDRGVKTRKRPGLLFLHGGFALGESAWALARPFREAGYVVMVPSLRGENGQPGHYSLFHDEVADILAAADALASRPDVDPGRLFVAGHSVGGTLTLLTALASDRFAAAASFSAAPDVVEFVRGRPERVPFDRQNFDEFRIRSPVAFATSFRVPVRLFYGEDEYWLQPATLRTAILARRAALDVEAIEFPGGHDSVTPESVAACLRFFEEQATKATQIEGSRTSSP